MSDLIISDDGPIRTLRMNRPAKKNALTLEMYDTMAAAMEESGTTAPMFAETKQLRDALVSSEPVRSVLEMARQVDMALLSAVDLSAQSKALEYDVITRQLWQSLRDAGAVGDICSHYLDIDGKPIAHPIAARTITRRSTTFETCRSSSWRRGDDRRCRSSGAQFSPGYVMCSSPMKLRLPHLSRKNRDDRSHRSALYFAVSSLMRLLPKTRHSAAMSFSMISIMMLWPPVVRPNLCSMQALTRVARFDTALARFNR